MLAAEVCGLEATVMLACNHSQSCVNAPDSSSNAAASAEAEKTWDDDLFGDALSSWLAGGGLAIVPYDAGSSHEPVTRGGAAAHYVLLVATASSSSSLQPPSSPLPPSPPPAPPFNTLWIGVHGLSRHPLILHPSQLAASNLQLMSMKPGVTASRWTLGDAGIRLSRRLLLLAPPQPPA